MSEDAAFRRAKAARLVRQYPELHAVIAKGEIHLTGLLMTEVPAVIEPLGPASRGRATHRAFVEAASSRRGWHDRFWPTEQRPDGSVAHPEEPAPTLHYKVQFTAGQEYVDLLNEALDLLGSSNEGSRLPEVHLRAMQERVARLRQKNCAARKRSPVYARATRVTVEHVRAKRRAGVGGARAGAARSDRKRRGRNKRVTQRQPPSYPGRCAPRCVGA
jgi:hypothetical protein